MRPRLLVPILLVLLIVILPISTFILFVALSIYNGGRGPDGIGSNTHPARGHLDTTVVRVVDGDTLVADVSGRAERVRLIGIDTPETVSPSKPVQCYGRQASDHLKAMLPKGASIRLVTDADTRDVYGRLLAYVYRQPDGLFVNLELARDGFASLLTFPPNVAHEPQLSSAVDQAHQRRLGLWGTCGGPGVPLSQTPAAPARDPGSGG